MSSFPEFQQLINPWMALTLPVIALAVSFSALTVAILNYRRKSSFRIRGTYRISSSIFGEDKYVSSVTLENLKDRAVTIFGIFLRVGYNLYIRIEEFEGAPLIIKPFETWHSEYGPHDFYAANLSKVDLNEILWDRKIKQRLVLSTSDGKYLVKQFQKPWDPVAHHLLKNRLTTPIKPMRLYYKGKSFGGNTKYLIEIEGLGVEPLIIPIHSRDGGTQPLQGVTLTEQSLKSAADLEQFLKKKKKEGYLAGATFKVIVATSLRRKDSVFDGKERIKAKAFGFFLYYVVGPLFLKYDGWRKNKKKTVQTEPFTEAEQETTKP